MFGFISKLLSLSLSQPMRQAGTFNFPLDLEKLRLRNMKVPLPHVRSFCSYPQSPPPSRGQNCRWNTEKVTLGRWFWIFRKRITLTNDLVIVFIASQWSVKCSKRRHKTISFDAKLSQRLTASQFPGHSLCPGIGILLRWLELWKKKNKPQIRGNISSTWSLLYF